MKDTIDFFSVCPQMRGFRGDTFPRFNIRTNLDSLAGYSMKMYIEDKHTHVYKLSKTCRNQEFSDETKGFSVQLESTDTSLLSGGLYMIHFVLTDRNDKEYRKLVGTLEIIDVPEMEE